MTITATRLKTRTPGYDNLTDTDWQGLVDTCRSAIIQADGQDRDDVYRDEQIIRATAALLAFRGVDTLSQANYSYAWYANWHDIIAERAPAVRRRAGTRSGGTPTPTPTPGGLEVMSINVTQSPVSGEATIHVTRTDGTTQNFTISMNELLTATVTEYSNARIAGNLTQRYGPQRDFAHDHSGGGTPPGPTALGTVRMWANTSTAVLTSYPNNAVQVAVTSANRTNVRTVLHAVSADSYLFIAVPSGLPRPTATILPSPFAQPALTTAYTLSGDTVYRTALKKAAALNNATIRLEF